MKRLVVMFVTLGMLSIFFEGCANINVNITTSSKEGSEVSSDEVIYDEDELTDDTIDDESKEVELEDSKEDKADAVEPDESASEDVVSVDYTEADVAGDYVCKYTEEIEGEEIACCNLLILDKDTLRGFSLVQDAITFDWGVGEAGIYTVNLEGETIEYSKDKDIITVSYGDGFVKEYVRADENDEEYIKAKDDFLAMCGEGYLYVSDYWTANYNPYSLYISEWEDGSIVFSYCEPGVQIAGSNYVAISYIKDSAPEEVLGQIKDRNNESDVETKSVYFGAEGYEAYTYSVGEGDEPSISTMDYTALDVQDGTLLVEAYSTIEEDDTTAMIISSAFEQLLGSFTLN